ncbi:hypothetical protein E4T66_19890 [Sinimarinibacterium sp. CAU 1509]|uniref:hypothetical protein n=1 Tax=Sinimarinibacterium sp. CAU 1509 TaxID=2562283 RepID=UPI0010ACE696|nr:hypothetical protein [Sinimarinibacterium sp. CAU 1509]TJY56224.1 hypothetical protein E4T66_19890 [Sinimarinibacterium sp. CAU 1509]
MRRLLLIMLSLPMAACVGDSDAMLPASTGNVSATARSVPKVILDGDVGPDPCDVGTLAMAHNLHRAGEIRLLGFMATLPESSNIEVIDILNKWYGHDVPIGVFKDPSDQGYSQNVQLASAVTHELFPATRIIAGHYADWTPQTYDSVPGSVELYRRLLAAEPGRSVTILTVGQLYNLKALLNSGPDEFSPLSGMQLVQAKVDRIIMMVGGFGDTITSDDLAFYEAEYFSNPPNSYGVLTVAVHSSTGNGFGAEYNAHGWYPGLTEGVFEKLNELDLPKVIIGHEPGWRVPAGEAYNGLDVLHPVRMAYVENNIPSKQVHPGVVKNDPAYDELALLYLARGKGDWFEELGGHATFEQLGTSTWFDKPEFQHTRLALTPHANEGKRLSRLIESLVMGEPDTWRPQTRGLESNGT